MARARQERERGGAIIAGKIDDTIEVARAEFARDGEIADCAFEDEAFVNSGNGWQQLFTLGRHSEREVGLREMAAQRTYGRRCQDQITEPAQLDQEDAQTLNLPSSRAKSRDPAMNLTGNFHGIPRLRFASLATRKLHHRHSLLVRPKQACAEMIPGEIFHDALPCRRAHLSRNFRMTIEMLDRARDGIDVA